MRIIYNDILPPKFYKEITILCFIFAHKGTKVTEVDVRHEEIHWEQEKELGIIGFPIVYVLSFLANLIRCRNWHRAYRHIALEMEAYLGQYDENYLQTRQHYCWFNYL